MLTALALVAGRAADIGTTLRFNPSLSREANPVITIFGITSHGLVIWNLVGVSLLFLIPLIWYVRHKPVPGGKPNMGFLNYTCLQLYGTVLPKNQFLRGIILGWPVPKNWIQAVRAFGIAGCWALIFASFQAVFAWWATSVWNLQWYIDYRSLIPGINYPVIELLPPLLILMIGFFGHFWKEYNELSTPEPQA